MKSQRTNLLIFILTFGVFGILNTEMGVIGIMPLIADDFNVSITKAGLIVSLFARLQYLVQPCLYCFLA